MMAEKVKQLYEKDSLITEYFHNELAGGKWDRMMAQTHIGYNNWQQPERNKMPPLVQLNIPEKAEMGVAIEGWKESWPGSEISAVLPTFDSFKKQQFYIEVFTRGKNAFQFATECTEDWVLLSKRSGRIDSQERIEVAIDWEKIEAGNNQAVLTVIVENQETEKIFISTRKI